MTEGNLPHIVTIFRDDELRLNSDLYHEAIRRTIHYILPPETPLLRTSEPDLLLGQRERFQAVLPVVTAKMSEKTPGTVSFFALSRYRSNSFKFFFDMISSWLVPGRRLNVVSIYAADFQLPALGTDIYTLCEVMIHVQSQAELSEILRNLPVIESEVRLGIESKFYSRRILEIRGMSADEKTAQIQEDIGYLMARLPRSFDHDVLTEMQHVLVMCRDDFKMQRESRHLGRIICYQYFFRRAIRENVRISPDKRHLKVKIFRARVNQGRSSRRVLGIIVGINFIRDKEVFEKRHLLKAVQNHVPDAEAVEHSFFTNRLGSEHIYTLYLEVFKSQGAEFSDMEIRKLREALPQDLKHRIERLMHPVFMPRNEEEIMRNILSLSNQIKFLRDIPQVFITFDEQTHTNLYFTVIHLRVKKHGQKSVQEMFAKSNTPMLYIHDRCQTAGNLRKKYKKEATVFRVKIAKEQFLRLDHSIDLNMARQVVVSELCRICGDLRDYNGGMISKQNELINALKKEILPLKGYNNPLLLENFFFSITPVVMRTILEPAPLQNLFMMMHEAIGRKEEHFRFHSSQDSNFAYVMITTEDSTVKERIAKNLHALHLQTAQVGTSDVSMDGVHYLGYLFRSDEPHQRMQFVRRLEKSFFAKTRTQKASKGATPEDFLEVVKNSQQTTFPFAKSEVRI